MGYRILWLPEIKEGVIFDPMLLYDTFHEQSYMCVPLWFYAKKNLYYKQSEDDKLLRSENGYIETFLWKRNGQK